MAMARKTSQQTKRYPESLSDRLRRLRLGESRRSTDSQSGQGNPSDANQDMGGRRIQTQFIEHAASLGIDAEVVPRNVEARGFHVVKRRWVVERTLGWLMLHRRLARDYETLTASAEAMIHIAMIDNVSKRITDETTPTWRDTY